MREGHEKDIRDRARIDDLVHLPWSLDERLLRAVRGDFALAADRSVNRERALAYDHDCASRMGVPAGRAARINRDLHHGDVCSYLKRNGPIRGARSTRQGGVREP